MNKSKQQIKIAKSKGISTLELLQMKEIARREAKKAEQQYLDKAFLYMLAIPLNILFDKYKELTKEQAVKYIDDVCNLYETVQAGLVTEQELADFLYDVAGVKIEAGFLKESKND